jgi:Fe-S-cluster containining protein
MLSSILSKKQCTACKFCCSFRRQSLWETPLFPPEVAQKLSKPNEYGVVGEFRDGQIVLGGYKTGDPEEEVPCTFLDPERGCIMKGEDKPFDCSIWPLRIMRKDGELVIALTPTCPSIGAVPSKALVDLVQDGLGDKIFEYAKAHPYIIKEYREGFPIIL